MAIDTNLVALYSFDTNGAPLVGSATFIAANGVNHAGNVADFPNQSSAYYLNAPYLTLKNAATDKYTHSFWFKDLKNRSAAPYGFLMALAYNKQTGGIGGYANWDYETNYDVVIYTNDMLGAYGHANTSAGASTLNSTGYQMTQAAFNGTGWHHMMCVFDGTQMTYYINGAQVGVPVNTTGMFKLQNVGSFTDMSYAAFDEMDELAIWQRAVTASEVLQIYNAGRGNLNTLLSISTNLVFNAPLGTDGNDVINGLAGATSSVSFVTDTGFTAADFASGSARVIYGIDSAQGPAVLGTSSFTLTAWVKPATPVNPGAVIIGTTISSASSPQYSGYQLRLNGTNLEFMIGGGGANEIPVSSSITFSAWHHVAVTRSGTAIVLYIDGAVVDTGTAGSVYDTANSWSGHFLTSGMTTDGSNYFYGYNGLISDTAMWKRALSGAEITSIYNAGTAKLSSLTALHLQGQFSTVVHSEVAENLRLEGQWSTVVHNEVAENLRLEGQFATVVHSVPPPAAIVPDITGTPGVPATFDGSASTTVSYYHWSWVSVPGGSSIANAAIPFPDNGATSPINMTNNQGLWHFEGNANDTSGNSRNGTVTGASLVAGKVGSQAYQFGVADKISFGAASNFISADFSISFWLKGDAAWTPATWDSILGASNAFTWSQGFGIFWQNATTIRCFVGSYTDSIADITVTAANWNHIVMTWDGANITAYLNGSLASTTAHTDALTGLANDFYASFIGTHGGGEQTIDELAIWSRAISASEVASIYAAQNGTLAGLGSDTFTFTPDIVGTYQINLAIDGSTNTNADCVVTLPAAGGGDPSQGASSQGGGLQGSGVDLQGYT